MERIVYVFRALASRPRMLILRSLVAEEERSVSAIETWSGLAMNSLCTHLRILATAGLVWRRRSGGSVFYRLAEEPTSPVTRSALDVVHRAFKGGSATSGATRRGRAQVAGIEEELFAVFTAFTHPRRIQILRHLDAHGETTADVLSETLSMSANAAARHLSKLSSRGFIVKRAGEGRALYAMAERMSPNAGGLLRAVIAATDGSTVRSRTS